jgi:protein-disulfide isomerase
MKFAVLAMLTLAVAYGGSRKDIVEGNPSSPVRVTIYEDLQCADCQRFRTMLDQKVLPRYGSRVVFVHRDFPLGKHDWARPAAVAARWVYEQDADLGIIFRREIMSEQTHLTADNLKAWISEFARRNHLDEGGIVASLTNQRLSGIVDQDVMGAVARGVAHTPTVYVGNQALAETILYEDLARLIDAELAR